VAAGSRWEKTEDGTHKASVHCVLRNVVFPNFAAMEAFVVSLGHVECLDGSVYRKGVNGNKKNALSLMRPYHARTNGQTPQRPPLRVRSDLYVGTWTSYDWTDFLIAESPCGDHVCVAVPHL
jgi:hypothetical protein